MLAPYAGEPELTDPAASGDWAAALADLAATPQVAPWCWYIARLGGAPVGMGAFKAPPDADDVVEIAYLTFIAARGTGVAEEIAAELVAIARGRVARIRAHTLPAADASTAALAANGFVCLGIVDDPEDGKIWRWERPA